MTKRYVLEESTGVYVRKPKMESVPMHECSLPDYGGALGYFSCTNKVLMQLKIGSSWTCPECRTTYRLHRSGEYGEGKDWFRETWWDRLRYGRAR